MSRIDPEGRVQRVKLQNQQLEADFRAITPWRADRLEATLNSDERTVERDIGDDRRQLHALAHLEDLRALHNDRLHTSEQDYNAARDNYRRHLEAFRDFADTPDTGASAYAVARDAIGLYNAMVAESEVQGYEPDTLDEDLKRFNGNMNDYYASYSPAMDPFEASLHDKYKPFDIEKFNRAAEKRSEEGRGWSTRLTENKKRKDRQRLNWKSLSRSDQEKVSRTIQTNLELARAQGPFEGNGAEKPDTAFKFSRVELQEIKDREAAEAKAAALKERRSASAKKGVETRRKKAEEEERKRTERAAKRREARKKTKAAKKHPAVKKKKNAGNTNATTKKSRPSKIAATKKSGTKRKK